MINLKHSYKRIFAFGCSYTRHTWPTWANIIASQYPNSIFYNLAKSGGGNQLLYIRLAQAHNKFQIDQDDLVLIMYPSYTREDRHTSQGYWHTPGNIFHEGNDINAPLDYYKFYETYGSFFHYILRDMSIIYMVESFLNNLTCDKISLLSTSLTGDKNIPGDKEHLSFIEDPNLTKYHNFINTYKGLLNKFPECYHHFLHKNYIKKNIATGVSFQNGSDSHPNPLQALEYLKHLGIVLKEEAYLYANEQNKKLLSCNSFNDILKTWHDEEENMDILIYKNGIV